MNTEEPLKDHTTDALYRRLKGHARSCSWSAGLLLGMNLMLAVSILRILFDLTDSSHEVLKTEGASELWIMSSIRLAASVIIFAIMRSLHEMSRYHAYLADFYYSRAQGLSLAIASKKEESDALVAYAAPSCRPHISTSFRQSSEGRPPFRSLAMKRRKKRANQMPESMPSLRPGMAHR